MTDQLDRLFADLRTEVLAEVRPRGVAEVRSTVRRRRLATSVAAGVALLAVAAGVAAVVAPSPPGEKAADPSTLSAWENQVSLAVGVDRRFGPADVLTSTGAGEMRADHQAIGGKYEVKAACAGEGVVTVTFESAGAAANTILVPCGSPTEPSVYTLVLVAEPKGAIDVRAVPDTAAAGHAAIAYQMKLSDEDRTRLQNAALAALPDAAGSATTSLLDVAAGARDRAVRPGRYQVWFTCVGTGTVRLTADLVIDDNKRLTKPMGRAELTCGPVVAVGSVVFTVPSTGMDALEVAVTPDVAATGQVAAAFGIARL